MALTACRTRISGLCPLLAEIKLTVSMKGG
jgi:hypothetical protein